VSPDTGAHRASPAGSLQAGLVSELPALVLHVNPGGLEHGGGIGRMIGYMIDAWKQRPQHPDMRVLDTRGAGHILMSPWHFARCLLIIAALTPRRPLLHVHVAGRGSTIRKIILVHFARALRLPVVLHLHDYDYRQSLQRFPKFIQRLARSMFRISNWVVVLGDKDRDLVETELGVSADRLSVVPNAVPAPPHKPYVAADALAQVSATGSVHILFLGNPSRRKGVHDLIAALAEPPLRDMDWHVTVAGGGDEIATFRETTHAAGLSERVDFTGWVGRAETMALLESADILVLPSYAEGMAMSVLEGMSYGLCVVCTPVGSLQYVVENEVAGLIVEPGNVPALRQALSRAVEDRGLRNRLGAEAARVFASKFDAASYPDWMRPIYVAAFAMSVGIPGGEKNGSGKLDASG
jgi:glycosyltransferase involved in cell wall biosynthesis